MKLKIFSLAFAAGFVFFFSVAAVYVYRFSAARAEEPPPEAEEAPFLEKDSAVFLLIFENEGEYGPFTLVSFDAKNGRIPVFTFSSQTVLRHAGAEVSAGELFKAVSPEIFAGTAEAELGIELSGYFIWNRESAEAVISKTGAFDHILPRPVSYKEGERYVDLSAGVQSMNGKKVFDIITYPKFSEGERCDTVSRIFAAFFERRLRRFLPEGDMFGTLHRYTETDVTAKDAAEYGGIIKALAGGGKYIGSHVTCDTEKDPETGLLYFSAETKQRVLKYFS